MAAPPTGVHAPVPSALVVCCCLELLPRVSTRLTVAPGATVPHSVAFSAGSTMSFASTVARNGGGTGDGGGRGDP